MEGLLILVTVLALTEHIHSLRGQRCLKLAVGHSLAPSVHGVVPLPGARLRGADAPVLVVRVELVTHPHLGNLVIFEIHNPFLVFFRNLGPRLLKLFDCDGLVRWRAQILRSRMGH